MHASRGRGAEATAGCESAWGSDADRRGVTQYQQLIFLSRETLEGDHEEVWGGNAAST
jgi:hypothetical protein